MRRALGLLILAAALVAPAAARAEDTGSVTAFGYSAAARAATATFAVTHTSCDDTGFCGWYAYAVARPADMPCDAGPHDFAWVGEYHDDAGSFSETDIFYPESDPVKLCIAVNDAADRHVIAETVLALSASGPGPLPACADWVDNDGDGRIDLGEDEGCGDLDDGDERLTVTPRLGVREAKARIRSALRREFGRVFRRGDAKRVRRCARVSRTRVRCRASWRLGDLAFAGHVTVWNTRHGERLVSDYAFKVRRVDEACRAAGGGRCVATYRVR